MKKPDKHLEMDELGTSQNPNVEQPPAFWVGREVSGLGFNMSPSWLGVTVATSVTWLWEGKDRRGRNRPACMRMPR